MHHCISSPGRNFFSLGGVPTVTKPGITITTTSLATAEVKTKPPLMCSSSVDHTTDDTAMHLTREADLSLSRCHLACCVLHGNVTRGALAISSLCESCVPLCGFPWTASAGHVTSLPRAGGSLHDGLGLHHRGGGRLDNWSQSPLRQDLDCTVHLAPHLGAAREKGRYGAQGGERGG